MAPARAEQSGGPDSAPDFLRYLKLFGVALLVALVAFGIWSGRTLLITQQTYFLYRYQIDKVANLRGPVATVFIGDSSLGNAIDASLFGELTHESAINLALAATYGYAGSYNMLRRVLLRFPPRNVVIVHTPEMMKHESDDFAYLMSVGDTWFALPTMSTLPYLATAGLEYLRLIYNVDVVKRNLAYAFVSNERANDWRYDYIEQRPPLQVTSRLVAKQTLAPGINPDKPRFLKKIADLCRSEHLNCLYVNGPLLEDICVASQPYLTQAAQTIRDSGIRLVENQYCLPAAKIGDSVRHVGMAYKAESTHHYYQLLAPLLQ